MKQEIITAPAILTLTLLIVVATLVLSHQFFTQETYRLTYACNGSLVTMTVVAADMELVCDYNYKK